MSLRERAALYSLALAAFFITPFIVLYTMYRQYVVFCLNVSEGVLQDVKNRNGSDRT